MRILLVQPKVSPMMVGFTTLVQSEPLALEYVAASVPQHEVVILDERVDPRPLVKVLDEFRPHLVGTTGYTTDVRRMREICGEVKAFDPTIYTVVGGHHASLNPYDFDIPCVDFIVIGEGEVTFPELVSCLVAKDNPAKVASIIYRCEGKQVETFARPMVRNLDSLPNPARHLSDEYRKHYHFHFWENPFVVETARGCPYRCEFCSVWKFHEGRFRIRSPECVLEDLKQVKTDTVCFVDDIFSQSFSHLERLYDLIKEAGIKFRYWAQVRSDDVVQRPDLFKKWAEIGLQSVLVGFETFRQADLDSVNKWNTVENNEKAMEVLHENGVDIWGAFIVDPSYTVEDFKALAEYVRSKKIAFPQFTVLTPLPGTELFMKVRDQLITLNYDVYDLLHTVLPTKLSLEEFYKNMAELYASTTMGWAELKRRIRTGKIPITSLERIRELLGSVTTPEAYLKSVSLPEPASGIVTVG